MRSKIVKIGNLAKLEINGKIYDPLSFKSFRPTDRNISDFFKAGIRLFCILSSGRESATKGFPYSLFGESWIGEYEYDFNPIDAQLDFFIKNAPDAYFMLMLQVDTRSWWFDKYENSPDSFWELSKVAADEKWRKAASAYIEAVIKHVEEKYPDKIYCYFLLGGCTTEWFSERDYEGYNDIKEKSYKLYCGNENAVIPGVDELELDESIAFIDPKEKTNIVTYRRFHNELIADTLLFFADKIREMVGRDRLIGAYFGYILELGGETYWDSGSLAYEKVFNSTSIDIIASPSAYTLSRRHEGTSAYMVTADTLALNNKLYYLEFDQRTYLQALQINELGFPGHFDKLPTEQATIDVMRRDFMLTLTKGMGIWWFDMFEGWYYSAGLMNEISNYRKITQELAGVNAENNSEIAFIVDPESFYYVNKNANLNGELLKWERNELAKIGAPYDIYSICSLDKIDFSKYKLIIFPTLFKYDKKIEEFINNKLKKDGKVILFMYAPFYVNDNGFSIDNMNAVTEMKLKQLKSPENIIQYKEMSFGFSFVKDTMFCVDIDGDFYALDKKDEFEVLGRYQGSLTPALVRRTSKDYKTVFCGSGFIRAKPLRDIAAEAGVHIYSCSDENIVFVNSVLIGIYHRNATDAIINVKQDGNYKDVFTGKEYVAHEGKLLLPYSEKERAKLLIYKTL